MRATDARVVVLCSQIASLTVEGTRASDLGDPQLHAVQLGTFSLRQNDLANSMVVGVADVEPA